MNICPPTPTADSRRTTMLNPFQPCNYLAPTITYYEIALITHLYTNYLYVCFNALSPDTTYLYEISKNDLLRFVMIHYYILPFVICAYCNLSTVISLFALEYEHNVNLIIVKEFNLNNNVIVCK